MLSASPRNGSRPQLAAFAAAPALDPTYSPAEVAAAWGLSLRTIEELVRLGRVHRGLHPTRGGLWPTYRPTHRSRRIPAAAMARHLAHMERLAAMPRPIRVNG